MIENILISIGIPCYNAEETIGETIKSIITQTYKDWELIIVDDGSTDDSLSEIKKIKDFRIKILSRENRGLPATLNEIVSLAEGDFFARMDADDIMLPDRLEKQIKYFDKHPEVDLLGGGIVCIEANGNETGRRFAPSVVDSAYRVFKGEVLYHPTVMGRTEWFREHPYDESVVRSEDFELWCRTAGATTIHNLQIPLIYYREYEENTSLSKYLMQSRISRDVIRRYGKEKIGTLRTYYLILRRILKDFAYIACFSLGAQKYILARRNS